MHLSSFFPKQPIFTAEQLERISNIFDNAGQVILGLVVVSPLVGGIDRVDVGGVVLGLITVILCWTVSIRLARKKDIYADTI